MKQISIYLGFFAVLWLAEAAAASASQTPATTAAASVVDDSEPPPQPSLLLWATGSPQTNTIWRGWPVQIRIKALTGEAPTTAQLSGATPVPLTPAKPGWVISETDSATLAPGQYVLSAGSVSVPVTVTDAPATLTAAQQSARWRLRVQTALARGDAAAAKQAADEWTQARPDAYSAHEARGDALRELGDVAGAGEAYEEAIARLRPAGEPPPAGLIQKAEDLRNAALAGVQTRDTAPPGADTVNYFSIISEGDRALAAGDRAKASARYADAAQFYRDHALTVSPLELREKQAYLNGATANTNSGTVQVSPQVAATAQAVASSAVQPTKPNATVAASPSPPSAPETTAAAGSVVSPAELTDAQIGSDAKGQWAAGAQASSEYGSPGYAATQATGAPNVKEGGDNPSAWCPGSSARSPQWLELAFAKPVHATALRVRQSYNPGAIVKVEAIDSAGQAHLWWSGIDPARPPGARGNIAWFTVRVPRTEYRVTRVRLTLDIDAVASWQEIDAVQLVGDE